jgi:hypothetical protein
MEAFTWFGPGIPYGHCTKLLEGEITKLAVESLQKPSARAALDEKTSRRLLLLRAAAPVVPAPTRSAYSYWSPVNGSTKSGSIFS